MPSGWSEPALWSYDTYLMSVLVADTSNSARTQVNSGLLKEFRHPWTPTTVSFPGGNRDTALPFFSCIAERARSIVGQLLETWNELVLIECRIFTRPSQRQNKPTQTKTKRNPPNQQKPTHKVLWNFAKRCETKVKRLAPLSPSCDLFHHVVILHAIRVIFRCPSCLRLPFLAQAGLSHPARVDVAWAGKCPLWSATSLHNVP